MSFNQVSFLSEILRSQLSTIAHFWLYKFFLPIRISNQFWTQFKRGSSKTFNHRFQKLQCTNKLLHYLSAYLVWEGENVKNIKNQYSPSVAYSLDINRAEQIWLQQVISSQNFKSLNDIYWKQAKRPELCVNL